MTIDKLKEEVRAVLSDSRYAHTIRVMETAQELVKRFGGVDEEKVKIAALLHDYAKCFSVLELEKQLMHYGLTADLVAFHYELWHGPVAAELMEDKFAVRDKDVLNAIRYHTTGRPQMTQLEYILFVADYMEPGRDFPGVDDVRLLAQRDLKTATWRALQNTIIFLLKKDATIHPNSFLAYNALTDEIKERA